MNQRCIFISLFVLLIPILSSAQKGIELGVGIGSTLKIHPDFPEINSAAKSISLSYIHKLDGLKSNWPKLYSFPIFDLKLGFDSFGNTNTLGYGLSLTPSLSFYLMKRDKIDLLFAWGIGLGWISRPFNKIDNTENIAIGSHMNFTGLARIYLKYRITEKYQLTGGVQYMHYSNGNVSFPNIGLNIPALAFGVQYLFDEAKPENRDQLISRSDSSDFSRKFGVHFRASLGFRARGIDGPVFPLYTFSLGTHRLFGKVHFMRAGLEFIFNRSSYEFLRHIELDTQSEFWQASRISIYLGHEFLLGRVGFLTEPAIYLNSYFLQRSRISAKIGFTLYGKSKPGVSRYNPHIGLYIHTIQGEAEFTEVSFGIDF